MVRGGVRKFIEQVARVLNKLSGGRITPTAITLTSAAMHVGIAWLVATQQNLLAALLLLVFGLFDALDGSLARLQGSESRFGMLLDSVTDRIKEVLLYAGAAYAMVASGNAYWAVWAVAAIGASFLVSYSNAWGEAMISGRAKASHSFNRAFRSGIMSFDVRLFVFWVGLLTNQVILAIIIITIGASITALQRLNAINQALKDVES